MLRAGDLAGGHVWLMIRFLLLLQGLWLGDDGRQGGHAAGDTNSRSQREAPPAEQLASPRDTVCTVDEVGRISR